MHPLFHWKVGHHRLIRRERFVGYLPFAPALTTDREFADVIAHVNLKCPEKAGRVPSMAASDTVVAKISNPSLIIAAWSPFAIRAKA